MKHTPATTKRIKSAGRAEKRKRQARRANNGRWPLRDEDYKAWIRTLPCVVCYRKHWGHLPDFVELYISHLLRFVTEGWGWRNECAHMGERGLGQKCSDRETLPLCTHHHGHGHPESAHTLGKRFAAHHGLDIPAIIEALNAAYDSRAVTE